MTASYSERMQKKEPAAQSADWERALEGIDFPISQPALVRSAHDKGGIDSEVIHMLERLHENAEFESRDQLTEAIRDMYAQDGFGTSGLPI